MICFTLFIDNYSMYINRPCFMFRYIIRFVDGDREPHNCYQKSYYHLSLCPSTICLDGLSLV